MQSWSGEQLAIEVSGPQGNSEIVVRHPYALVGALARADVRLSGEGVQKREALLYVADGGKVFCRRLEAALPEISRELSPEEWLPLGAHRLRARVIAASQGSKALSIDSEIKPRIPVLRVRRKGRQSVNRRLWGTLGLVGRAEDCEVPLLSTTVSLYHCILFRESNRLWCIDLGSGNGTLLNGQAIECVPVEMGSRLQVGDFELEFQRYSRRSAPSSAAGENAAGSHLGLSTPLLAEERPDQIPPGSHIGVQVGELILGSNIGRNEIALLAPASSLSGMAALPAPLPADFDHVEAQQAELIAQQADLQRGLDALAESNARMRSDQEAFAEQLSERIAEQRAALIEELKQQSLSDRQALNDLMESLRQSLSQELLGRLEESRRSQAQELLTRIDSQRHTLAQELTRRLEAALDGRVQQTVAAGDPSQVASQSWSQGLDELRNAQSDEIALAVATQQQALSQELAQRLEELQTAQAQRLASQIEQQRQSLLQELARQLEAQQAALSRELLAQMESQRTALLQEQQADADAVNQQLQSLLSSLEQIGSQQSQFGSQLAAQAEQIQAAHQALAELRSEAVEQRALPARESDRDSRLMTVVSLDSDAPETIEAAPDSEIALLPQTAFAADSSIELVPLARKAVALAPKDDRLLHFVSDRLAEMDLGRQRRMVVYWAIAIAAAGMLSAGAWALWSWFGPQSS